MLAHTASPTHTSPQTHSTTAVSLSHKAGPTPSAQDAEGGHACSPVVTPAEAHASALTVVGSLLITEKAEPQPSREEGSRGPRPSGRRTVSPTHTHASATQGLVPGAESHGGGGAESGAEVRGVCLLFSLQARNPIPQSLSTLSWLLGLVSLRPVRHQADTWCWGFRWVVPGRCALVGELRQGGTPRLSCLF